MYNLREQLWFQNPDFKSKSNDYFDPLAWKVDKFNSPISQIDFVTEEEFRTYVSIPSTVPAPKKFLLEFD